MARRRIEGCRVLVTGASSGIGRELALELARAGADLVVVARREEPLSQLAAEVRRLGRRCEPVVGDVTDADTRRRALTAAEQKLDGLDALVNNAGVSAHGHFADAGPDRLRRIMEVNFFAAAELVREALPLLARGRQPIIVNVGSILARRGAPKNSEYSASKFALQGWSEALRAELAPRGIDLLMVNPGPTETEFFDHLIERDESLSRKDRRATPASVVARKTVRAMRRGRHEIVPSVRGNILLWLNRLSPRLVDQIMRRYG